MSEAASLAAKLSAIEWPEGPGSPRRKLRFSYCRGDGWVSSSSEEVTGVLCDLWNNRELVAEALREYAERRL